MTPTARELHGVDDFTDAYASWGRDAAARICDKIRQRHDTVRARSGDAARQPPPLTAEQEASLADLMPGMLEIFWCAMDDWRSRHASTPFDPATGEGKPYETLKRNWEGQELPEAPYDYGADAVPGKVARAEWRQFFNEHWKNERGQQGESGRSSRWKTRKKVDRSTVPPLPPLRAALRDFWGYWSGDTWIAGWYERTFGQRLEIRYGWKDKVPENAERSEELVLLIANELHDAYGDATYEERYPAPYDKTSGRSLATAYREKRPAKTRE